MKSSLSNIKKILVPLFFVAIITIVYALVFTLSEFADSPYSSLKDFLELAFQWTAIAVGTFGLLYLLSINKYVFAVTFPALIIFSTVLAYYRYTVNATFTPMTIELALINDLRTNMQVVSWQLVGLMFSALAMSIAIVWIRWNKVTFTRPFLHLIVAVGIIFMTNSLILPA